MGDQRTRRINDKKAIVRDNVVKGRTHMINKVYMLCVQGDIDGILDTLSRRAQRKKGVVERTIGILIGLSLKGYEGRSIGAIYLIGDVEGVQKNTRKMIINPFRGWRDINILDQKQQLTFEAFSQLDGAIVLDSRGYAHSAGRMILLKGFENSGPGFKDNGYGERGGAGTRWRAAKYITGRANTVAVSLSNRGDISVFERGKELGRLERKVCLKEEHQEYLSIIGKGKETL